jgi:hypothetical protein
MLRCKHTIRQTAAVPILTNQSSTSCHTGDGGGNPIGVGEYAGDFGTLPLEKKNGRPVIPGRARPASPEPKNTGL